MARKKPEALRELKTDELEATARRADRRALPPGIPAPTEALETRCSCAPSAVRSRE